MKNILIFSLTLCIIASLSSCVSLVNTLLGHNECNYTDCTRTSLDNCNYCMIHCHSYNVSPDLEIKVNKSIKEQIYGYQDGNKKVWYK